MSWSASCTRRRCRSSSSLSPRWSSGWTGCRTGRTALALPLVFLIGLGFYTVTVARHWKRFNRLSVAELFAERYSRTLALFASLMLLVAMSGFCVPTASSRSAHRSSRWPARCLFPPATALLTVIVLAGGSLLGRTGVGRPQRRRQLHRDHRAAALAAGPRHDAQRRAGWVGGAAFPPDQL